MSEEENASEGTSYSDWMAKLPHELLSVPLWNVALPGSHDSMSYDLDINSTILEPDSLTRFSKILPLRKIVRTWAITQDASIVDQLDAGVRYFDFRIARKLDDVDPTRLYFFHGLHTRTDVETLLKDINHWAELHPKEILILSFSHFKNFQKNPAALHSHFLNFIETLFGSKLIYRKCCPTVQWCWEQKRNVLIAYDFPAQVNSSSHPDICGKIPYFYGNTINPHQLEAYIGQTLERHARTNGFFVCGLNLTLPDGVAALKYILQPFNSLLKVIQRSLPELVRFTGRRAGGSHVSILASDLVTRDDFVSTVVRLNVPKHTTNTMNDA